MIHLSHVHTDPPAHPAHCLHRSDHDLLHSISDPWDTWGPYHTSGIYLLRRSDLIGNDLVADAEEDGLNPACSVQGGWISGLLSITS